MRWAPVATLVLSDLLLALLAWEAASVLQGLWGQGPLSDLSAASAMPVAAAWVALRALLGIYPGYGLGPVELLRRHVYSVVAGLAVLAVFAMGFQVAEQLSRLLLVFTFLGLLLLTPFMRSFLESGMKEFGLWGKPVMVLSYKEAGPDVTDLLKRNWQLGYYPIAIFDYRLDVMGQSPIEGADHRRTIIADVADIAREQDVDTVIFAMPHVRREQLAALVSLASLSFQHVMVIPNLEGVTNSAVVARNLAGTFAVDVKYNLLNPWALRAKRVADLVATVLGGVVILPLLIILTLLVYLESGAPVFYADKRMGKDGKLFSCVKFRTMVPDAETLLQQLLQENADLGEEYAKYHKLRNDPRITRIGSFLRKTSLDELPQLWNVLRGEMSLVGPRPYLPRESQEIGVTQSEILRVPPGVTGPWQVSGRNHTSFGERVQMDAHYVHDWSVWLDIVLLVRTVRILLRGRAAY